MKSTTTHRSKTASPSTNGNGHNGHSNRLLKAGHGRMFAAAAVDRLTADWNTLTTSANAQLLVSRKALISRSQELERDVPYYRKILDIHVNNVIGHRGIRLQMEARLKNGKPDKKANDAVATAWDRQMRMENCTVSRNLTGIEVQCLAMRSFIRDGGLLMRKYPGFANDFRYAIEPIDISRLDHDYNLPINGIQNQINFGIEMDQYKAPLAYHVLERHPGEVFAWRTGPKWRERIPSAEVIPVWTVERAGQLVMAPPISSVMKALNFLLKYTEAEVIAAWVASCKGGFLEKTQTADGYTGETDDQGNTVTEVQPGMIEELPWGYQFKANDPTHPTDAFQYFVKSMLRQIASGAGVPYNDLANDLEGVNFSSIRSGLLECREGYKASQRLMIDKLMTPWFESWLRYALMAGKIAGYTISDYDRLNSATWKPRRWDWVDPQKDLTAALMAVNGGLDSRTNIVAESDLDEDFAGICDQQKNDEQTAKDAGLSFVTEVPKLSPAKETGANPADPEAASASSAPA